MPRKPYVLPPELQLEKIIPLQDASDVCGLSEDTIKRNHPDKIIQLSKRRVGIRLKHVLRLA